MMLTIRARLLSNVFQASCERSPRRIPIARCLAGRLTAPTTLRYCAVASCPANLRIGGSMIGSRVSFFLVLFCVAWLAASARAEKIRTSHPRRESQLSLACTAPRSVISSATKAWTTKPSPSAARPASRHLVSGDVDFSGAGGSGLRGAVRGAPLKAIFYQTEKPTWYLVVHPSISSGLRPQGQENRRRSDRRQRRPLHYAVCRTCRRVAQGDH